MLYTPAVTRRSVAYAPAFRSSDRGFERFVNEALSSSSSTIQRGASFEQGEKCWTLSLDLPGLAKDDLSIGLEGSVVRIETRPEAKRTFKAAYELPQEIDAAASAAKLENGVLTLTLAKLAPLSKVTPLVIA